MIIMGIDPGIGITGYSFIDYQSKKTGDYYSLIASGSIQTDKNLSDSKRLLEIFNDLSELVEKYQPDCASVENLFLFTKL